MAINLNAIRSLLLPGLNAIFGDYQSIPTQWRDIFEFNTSDMSYERDIEVKLFGYGAKASEGEATTYQEAGERAAYVYNHFGVRTGFIMTKYAIEDNQYKSQFKPNAAALKRSMAQTKEVYAAAILNNANDTNYKGGDGVPLLSTAHPLDVGTLANTPTTQAELNETSLGEAGTAVRGFKDAAGLKIMARGRKLIVPPQLEYTANRLLRTPSRVGTTDNDVNAVRDVMNLTSMVSDFLTNPKSWYLKTDVTGGLKHFQRTPIEITMQTDFENDNLKTKAHERYSFGWSDVRGLFGNMP